MCSHDLFFVKGRGVRRREGGREGKREREERERDREKEREGDGERERESL